MALPDWKVSTGERPGTLNLVCPRKGCEGKLIVSKKIWLQGTTEMRFVGRSCPYCFRANNIPRRLWDSAMERMFGMERDSREEREQ